MSVTTTFTGFDPPKPARRSFDVYRMLAQINRDEDATRDLLRLANIINEVIELLLFDIDRWIDIFDINRADETFVDLLLDSLGNPFAFDLDLNKKRKLGLILVEIYKLKGTEPGICNTLRFFLGLECDLVEFNDSSDDTWILGESELGVGSFLGLDTQRAKFAFNVIVDRALTAQERLIVNEIVDYMKPAHTHHILTVEP